MENQGSILCRPIHGTDLMNQIEKMINVLT
jgi:hypothetical protein